MSLPAEKIQKIIVEGDAKVLVEEADQLGKRLARNLSSSQIRNVFGIVKRVSQAWTPSTEVEEARLAYKEILLLKPKLAYQEGRFGSRSEKGQAINNLRQVLEPCIDMIEGNVVRFQNFSQFFEAILAYHKAYGGR
jgi:CRISPR-associated protein Csm2